MRTSFTLALAALAIAVAVTPSLTTNVEAAGTTTIVGTIAAFAPAVGVVGPGDTVTFLSADVPHTLTSDDTYVDANGNIVPLFDTGFVSGGSSGSFKAPSPGEYDFRCLVHPAWMIGKLIVN